MTEQATDNHRIAENKGLRVTFWSLLRDQVTNVFEGAELLREFAESEK